MAHVMTYEVLEGVGQGQTVRVLIEVIGPSGDVSEIGLLTRREMVNGLAVDIARSAKTFGVELAPTGESLSVALRRF